MCLKSLDTASIDVLNGWLTNGVFSPFFLPQLMIIVGFAEGVDPIAQAANALPRTAGVCRELAMPVYLLQLVVIEGLGTRLAELTGLGTAGLLVLKLLVLLAISALVAYGVQRPFNAMVQERLLR